MARKKPEPAPAEGEYALHVVDAETIRLDLYGQCVPQATGDPVPGWGTAYLSPDRALELAKALTNAVVRAQPTPAKKTRKK